MKIVLSLSGTKSRQSLLLGWLLAFAFAAASSAVDSALPASTDNDRRHEQASQYGKRENAERYNPRELFGSLQLPTAPSVYRSSNGAPGPSYWQNRADYNIRARLDPRTKRLRATEVITYINNSPDTLGSLWLQLDQNVYRSDARVSVSNDRPAEQFTDGYTIGSIEVEQGSTRAKVKPLISDTRMQIVLKHPLAGSGAKLRLRLSYEYEVPGSFGGRTAWVDTKNGPIFDIAQWYPRMCVYDDIRGWDTLPYLHQEFYLEFGTFDYAVTVPDDMIVLGTGQLLNPAEVLTPTEHMRLERAAHSDTTVVVRALGERAALPAVSGKRTWRYRMTNTRDVAFSASPAFIWDAARIELPAGKHALAESVYPAESQGKDAWSRSTEYLKDAVKHFSQRWYSYPYPAAINVAGGASGMEYPGMAFDGIDDRGKALFWITAHEIGHTWFPMTVGFDERRNAWMDEGFNTFIDTFESDEFDSGVYGPKRDAEYAPRGGNPVDEILPVLADSNAPPILTRADLIPEEYRHPVTYFKSALGLILLRNQNLGADRFDHAFRKFISDWAFKHPQPSDFFRAMESEGGEDLGWWWRGWYFNNWQLDLAVTGVSYVDSTPAKGARITVETLDRLVMPSTVEIRYKRGRTRRLPLPVETWLQRHRVVVTLSGGPPIEAVTIDPDHRLPDRDRSNNVFYPTTVDVARAALSKRSQ